MPAFDQKGNLLSAGRCTVSQISNFAGEVIWTEVQINPTSTSAAHSLIASQLLLNRISFLPPQRGRFRAIFARKNCSKAWNIVFFGNDGILIQDAWILCQDSKNSTYYKSMTSFLAKIIKFLHLYTLSILSLYFNHTALYLNYTWAIHLLM